MTQTTRKGGEKMLVLGFDAGCGTCAEIAGRVEERVGEALAVRNLADPEVTAWREQALGKDAPFAPTLFEVEGDEVRAWTGRKMALPLSRKLGLSNTWQLMQALGEMPNSGIQAVDNPGGGMSRGKFLKGVGGAALAMSVLSGVGPLASVAQAARKPQPYDIVKHIRLSGSQAQTVVRYARLSADTRVLIGNGLSTDAKAAAAKPVATRMTLRNGTIINGVTFRLPNNRELYKYTSTRRLPKALGVGTSLAKLYVKQGSRRVIYSGSEMGKIWRRPSSSNSRQVAADVALGGCPPVGSNSSGGSSICTTTLECRDFKPFSECLVNGIGGTAEGCAEAGAIGAVLIGATGGSATPYGIGIAVLGCGRAVYNGSKSCCGQWVPVCKPYPQIG